MKDFENDLIYYPNPDPVKEPRFILKSVDELEKSTKYSVTCNGTERVVYHTDSFDYVVVVDNEAYDLEISIHTPYEKLEIRPSSFGIVPFVKGETVHIHLDEPRKFTVETDYVYSESNLGEKTFLASQYYGKCQICGKQIFRSNGKPYFEACNILPTNAIPDRYKHSISEGWNSLCLCPNCAAEFKYGKKNLSELISMIQDYHVKENGENLITCRIEMQGKHRAIKYTGKHFLALQKAIGFYSDDAK